MNDEQDDDGPEWEFEPLVLRARGATREEAWENALSGLMDDGEGPPEGSLVEDVERTTQRKKATAVRDPGPPPPTPLWDRWESLKETRKILDSFFSWLTRKDYDIGQWSDNPFGGRRFDYASVHRWHLIPEYLGLDREKMNRERNAFLRWSRKNEEFKAHA